MNTLPHAPTTTACPAATSTSRSFRAIREAMPEAIALVRDACKNAGIPDTLRLNAELVVEELLINTLTYGHLPASSSAKAARSDADLRQRQETKATPPPQHAEPHMTLTVTPYPATRPPALRETTKNTKTTESQSVTDTVRIAYHDTSPPFNPLIGLNLPLGRTLASRKVGGLGRILVIKLAERVAYRYENGKNVLEIDLQKSRPRVLAPATASSTAPRKSPHKQ